jgi:hypothetical protein
MIKNTRVINLISAFLIAASSLLLLYGMIEIVDHSVVVRYDCRIAEISPDIPVKVKEQCRQMLRNEQEANDNHRLL